MKHWKLSKWCNQAVERIYYPPDRRAVYRELYQHVDERSDSFLAQGMTEEEAIEKTLQVMGDAAELKNSLGAVHRPFWGFACSITKWLFLLTAAGLVLLLIAQSIRIVTEDNYKGPDYSKASFDPYSDTFYNGDERTLYEEPGTTILDSGYRIKLSKVSCWDGPSGTLHFQLDITNLLPWADDPDFCNYITARDSLGNLYPFQQAKELAEDSDQIVTGRIYRTSLITWIYQGRLLTFECEGVQWVELCYNRDGRDIVFRVELPGGDLQ